MRKNKADTARTRAAIVAAATRLFRERGLEKVSVADVMNAAGLTHGGFYNHFGSKEDLQVAAINEAFNEKLGPLAEDGVREGRDLAAKRYFDSYLSREHALHLESGCPIAGLTLDVAHSGPAPMGALDLGTRRTLDLLAASFDGKSKPQDRAIEAMAGAVGAIVLARAVSDPSLQERILAVARQKISSIS